MLNQQSEDYLRWYYDSLVWTKTTFLGVNVYKSVTDLWNYQEIISQLRPGLVVEFGVCKGGSSLFLATVAGLANPESVLLSVDIQLSKVSSGLRQHNRVQWMESSSVNPVVERKIAELRRKVAGPMFVILDSDHTQAHVVAELELLRSVTVAGDYLVVEDGIVNGHPLLPGWGNGPMEAIQEYTERYPDDYLHDEDREQKFGFTFAPRGYLIRR